ncbi:MAG: hypothetical protein ACI9TK_000070 [Flavobacteriaceae bacterium]|jgi:hypothetical protein|tara:strand:- start:15158 stop:15937 length:780 start_codon:yes stop_codon:yes gene_type:complete
MAQKSNHLVFILGIVIFFSACKTVAILPTKTPLKNVDISALVIKTKSNYPKINKLRSRIRATYDDGKRKQQIIVQLRLENKKKVWLSGTMIIPIAKLMITPEGVSFYEKFQKNYFKGNFDLINAPFNTSFSFIDVENLLLGKPFLDPAVGRWKQISNPQFYILIPQGKRSGITPTLFYDPISFLLKEQRILIPGTAQTLAIKYLNHSRVNGETLPQNVEISLFDGKKTQSLKLVFTRTDFPDTLNFPFEIPEGYSKIKL